MGTEAAKVIRATATESSLATVSTARTEDALCRCIRCGHVLTAAKSVARQRGPVCVTRVGDAR